MKRALPAWIALSVLLGCASRDATTVVARAPLSSKDLRCHVVDSVDVDEVVRARFDHDRDETSFDDPESNRIVKEEMRLYEERKALDALAASIRAREPSMSADERRAAAADYAAKEHALDADETRFVTQMQEYADARHRKE